MSMWTIFYICINIWNNLITVARFIYWFYFNDFNTVTVENMMHIVVVTSASELRNYKPEQFYNLFQTYIAIQQQLFTLSERCK